MLAELRVLTTNNSAGRNKIDKLVGNIIWNKKVVYCFLSGLLTSLWLYDEAYHTPDYPIIFQFILVGALPGFLFPTVLLLTEDKLNVRNVLKFLLLSELLYVLSAISIWITVIHDYFIPAAFWFLCSCIPLCLFFLYYFLIKKVYRLKNTRNWIFAAGAGSIFILTVIAYFKVHFFHSYMIHPDRMKYYFTILVWCFPLWETAFAVIITMGEKRNTRK